MRVLLTADTVGGVWDYAATLAAGLARRGHRVLLAVLGEPGAERLHALPAGVEVEWEEHRLEWMPGGVEEAPPAAEWLRRLSLRWEAEVVHLNQLAYAVADFRAPTVVVAHSDVLSWFAETRGTPAPPEWGGYARAVREGIRAADALVAPTRHQAELTLRHFGRAADRVIHNGVLPPAEEPPPRESPLAIGVGRAWDDAKGMTTLDEAVGLLGRAAPPTLVYGAVDGPHGERFAPRHARAVGAASRAEVDAAMRRATLLVAPCRYEPFGLAPVEAALHGCALLLSDIPSFRELWHGCARFFPRGDAAALAAAVRDLHEDPARRADLAAAARERALARYGVERFVDEYADLYLNLALPSPLHPLTRSPAHPPCA